MSEADHEDEETNADEEHSEEDHSDEAATLTDLTPATLGEGEKLRLLATTSIVGDVVAQIGGDAVVLTVLMEPGQDPHAYQSTASDLAAATEANIIFVNGFNLEENLLTELENATSGVPIVPVSAGIEPLEFEEEDNDEEEEHHHEGADPHVWFDVHNVEVWTENIAASLSALDPANAGTYRTNAETYQAQLEELDRFVRESLATIPEANRKLVTNHDTFQYFARAYGFEVIGTVLPSFSTNVEPSAANLSDLIRTVQEQAVPAIFVETIANEQLADVVSEETGAQVYSLYTDALGPVGSGADTYIGLIRANTETLVDALTQ